MASGLSITRPWRLIDEWGISKFPDLVAFKLQYITENETEVRRRKNGKFCRAGLASTYFCKGTEEIDFFPVSPGAAAPLAQ